AMRPGPALALSGAPAEDVEVLRRGGPAGGTSGHDGWAAFYVPRGSLGDGPVAGTDPASGPTAEPAPGGRVAEVRAVLLVDSPRDVGPVRKAMNRTGHLRVDLDVALDPTRRLRDALR